MPAQQHGATAHARELGISTPRANSGRGCVSGDGNGVCVSVSVGVRVSVSVSVDVSVGVV
jgi:hypothetical protein